MYTTWLHAIEKNLLAEYAILMVGSYTHNTTAIVHRRWYIWLSADDKDSGRA